MNTAISISSDDRKALTISILLHGSLFLGVFLAGTLTVKPVKALVVDMSIFNTVPAQNSQPQAVSILENGSPEKPVQDIGREKNINRSTVETDQASQDPAASSKHSFIPAADSETIITQQAAAQERQSSTIKGAEPVYAETAAGHAAATASQARQYSREHFEYIQRLISAKVKYPRSARARNQEGTLIVSFVIRQDGSISQLHLVTSSGYEILDQNALESVKRAAPFPRPPVMAELKIPIAYTLSNS